VRSVKSYVWSGGDKPPGFRGRAPLNAITGKSRPALFIESSRANG